MASNAQNLPIRVMTYNALRFSDNDEGRQAAFQIVFEASNPDILIMQEIVNAAGADLLLDALNADSVEYARAPFIDGADMDNALFYRTSMIDFIAQDTIATALREISEYTIQIGSHPLRVYSAHLKAGSGPANENLRFDEAAILRDRLDGLPDSTEFILVGDLNLSESSEPAYQRLIADRADNDGRVRDLVDSTLIGKWRNNPAYAAVHSQSPRSAAFGGGASGGIDDRFDFILSSYELDDARGIEYVGGSYTVFGNDGLHFNKAVNDGANLVVSQIVADALHDASDHLPVYAEFISLADTTAALPALAFSEIFYDTPGTDADEEWIELFNRSHAPVDLSGWTIIDNNGQGSAFSFPAGTMIASQSYFTLANDPAAFSALYGYDADLYASIPRLNNSGDAVLLLSPAQVETDQVAWEGGASQGVPSFWDSDTAPLALRGESLVRVDVMQDSNTYTDWVKAADNGSPQVQATYISSLVSESVSSDSNHGAVPALLHQNYPNPARTLTSIEYALPTGDHVTLKVFDMLGREAAVLADGFQPAGAHRVVFDAGRLPNGLYIYRLQTATLDVVRQMVVVK